MDAHSLDTLLFRLRYLQHAGGVSAANAGAVDWYEVELFPSAEEARIASAQSLLGKALPAEFLHFWRFSDGANLFVNESGLHGVGITSTELIPSLQQEEAGVYGALALAPYAVFARVNGAGDFLAFDLGTGRVLDGVHAEQPAEWRVIAASFSDWLRRFIDCGGRYYWIEQLYDPAAEAEARAPHS